MSPRILNILKAISKVFLRYENSRDLLKDIQVIFVASYGAIKSANGDQRLARATRANMEFGIYIRNTFCPRAIIVFSSCQHSRRKPFPGAAVFEMRAKEKMLYAADIPRSRFLHTGQINNSFTEMERLRDTLACHRVRHDEILIVTCDLHSRAEKVLAKTLFPGSKISVRCNLMELEVEPDHSTADQRTWGRWLWCSWLRYLAFKATSLAPDFLRQRLFVKLRKAQHDSAS